MTGTRGRALKGNAMKPDWRKQNARNGSAIVTVMTVVLVMMIVAGSLYTVSAAMPIRVRRLTDAIRAKAIAEAGINRAYSLLRNDLSGGLAAFPFGAQFADGRYDLRAVSLSNGEARIISVGRFGTAEARVGADLRNTAVTNPGGGGNPHHPFGQSVFSNGRLTINGTPSQINGSLFTNNDFTLNGQYRNVNGLIYARNSESIPASHRGAWAEVPFPRQTDPGFAAFLEAAQAKGILRVFNGNTTFPRDQVYNGIVVVNGNLTHNGSGTRTVNGMLYVTGNVTFNGSSSITVNGSLLVGGNITFNGSSIVNSRFTYDPTFLPHEEETPEDHVVIDVWWE